jgi:hypothetical protein
MEVRGAPAAGVAAAIELTVANNAVVATDDGASSLAALGVRAERGTLPAEGDGVLGSGCPRHDDRKPRCRRCCGNALEHAAPGRSGRDRPR